MKLPTVFEDCGTAFIGQNSESISITNSCGIFFLIILTYQYLFITRSITMYVIYYYHKVNVMVIFLVFINMFGKEIKLPGNCDSWVFLMMTVVETLPKKLTWK